MRCPNCGSDNIRVKDSRHIDKYGGAVCRKRYCYSCGEQFITYEVISEKMKDLQANTQRYYRLLRITNEIIKKCEQIKETM